MLHLVVDAANVVGSRPDGWWRDRAGAARRLAGGIVAVLVSRPEDLVELLDGTTPRSDETAGSDLSTAAVQVHLVLEGAANAVEDLPTHPLLDVVHARADGDSAIVALVEALATGPDRVIGGDGRPRPARPGAGGRRRRHRPGDVPRSPALGLICGSTRRRAAPSGAAAGWSRRRSS